MGSAAFYPSSGGLLFGCTAAAGSFGEGILELTATAAFGFELGPRFVAVTAGGAEAHAKASPSSSGSRVADDSCNGREENLAPSSRPSLSSLPVVASH